MSSQYCRRVYTGGDTAILTLKPTKKSGESRCDWEKRQKVLEGFRGVPLTQQRDGVYVVFFRAEIAEETVVLSFPYRFPAGRIGID